MKNKIIFLILTIFSLTGCYNYRELNTLAIMSAVGIDKKDGKYQVTIQVINTQQGDENGSLNEQTKFITYKTEGDTLQEALRKVVLESPKRLYGNHLELLVIGEEYAKEGIGGIFDFFMRNLESRKQFTVVLARDTTAQDVLEVLTPLETTNAKNILSSIEVDSQYYGSSQEILFEKLVQTYLNNKKDIIIPSIEVIGEEDIGENLENLKESNPETKLVLSNMAILKKDKLVGYLNEEESKISSILANESNVMIINCECDNNKYITIQTTKAIADISPIKNELKVKIKINLEGNISEIHCNMDLNNPKVISDIEKMYEEKIKQLVSQTLNKINIEYNSDTLGLLDIIYKSNPKYYYQIKDKWYEENLKNIEFDINVNVTLKGKGNAVTVIPNEKD
ncbi:MAG: Ger(x)C family spore germination protein [Clostridium sp.]|nr:Ger(x)C family spore germination protein [Clostridium sp.]MCM1444512.1 Ger(x)C family spore germination protein [Candidatus Amulumruptor caecigallinarius]